MGTAADDSNQNIKNDSGIIPRACQDLFAQIEAQCDGNAKVSLSYLELYNEHIRDLLQEESAADENVHNPQQSLRIRETLQGEIYVAGAVERPVDSPQAIGALMAQASARRVVAATNMNATSSRSHAICTLRVEGLLNGSDDGTSNGGDTKFSSKLTLVDLAGSERIKKTGAVGARQTEGININKSLLVLGQVVSALSEKKRPPYRDSKLTRLLQDSLGGNSRTILVACVSPADYNMDESVNTLRYAARARKIQNTATRNLVQNISPEEAAALKRDNALLRQQVVELQQTIRRLTASPQSSQLQHLASPSPTNTLSTFCSEDEEDEESGGNVDEGNSKTTLPLPAPPSTNDPTSVPQQIDVSQPNSTAESSSPQQQQQSPLPISPAANEGQPDVAEYLIQISNLKVEVAQLKGDMMENERLAKRHAELQVRFAEVQAEADSARIAASYMSDIVDELRGLKHDDLARKQWVLQLKLKEQNMFSLVQAMLETYRMQLGKLSIDFEKSIVRTVDNLALEKRSLHFPHRPSPPTLLCAADADEQSLESFGDKNVSRSSGWWSGGSKQSSNHPPESSSSSQHKPPILPWKQATSMFRSQIREIERHIGSDMESLMSNMKNLAEEARVLEMELGNEEISSQRLLSEETKSELVDHLSSILMVKEAAPIKESY